MDILPRLIKARLYVDQLVVRKILGAGLFIKELYCGMALLHKPTDIVLSTLIMTSSCVSYMLYAIA